MRTRYVVAAAFLISAGGTDYLACNALLRTMQGSYARWTGTMAAQGWTVRAGSQRGHLTPFGADLLLEDVSVEGASGALAGGLTWHAPRVVVSMDLLHPRRLRIAPQDEQELRLAAGPTLVFGADRLTAIVPVAAGRPDHLDVVADGLVAGLQRPRDRESVRIGHAELHLRAGEGAAAELVVTSRGIGLPDDGRWPLGGTIGRLVLDVAMTPTALPGGAPAAQARAWRDGGGALRLRHLALHWGPLDLTAQGTLHLDQNLQPEGSGDAKITGASASLTALAQGGAIPDGLAQTGQLLLGLMARPAEGGADSVDLPVKLKQSTLSIGRLPLLSVKTLDWGGA